MNDQDFTPLASNGSKGVGLIKEGFRMEGTMDFDFLDLGNNF